MKKIGIVVPIYNEELYLEQCITSILRQTYTNLELILVDDGSTDNSGKICDEFAKKDKRVSVIHQNNQGMLCARYNGLKALKCDYATFVDADDWISEDTYEKMSKYMEQEIDMITFQIVIYHGESYHYISHNDYEKGLYNKARIEQKLYSTMIWDILKGTYGFDPSLCNKIVKRELLLKELYEAKALFISYGQDIAVTYPLITKIQSLMITEESLYYYRQRNKGQIAPYIVDSEYYKKLYWLYEYLYKYFKEYPQLIKQMDYFYAEAARMHLRIYRDKKRSDNFLFPFNKVPVGKRIILYGASILGQTFYGQIKKIGYADIVAWVDRDYEAYKEFRVREVEYINVVRNYDYIVIAVINSEASKEIKKNLKNMGVEDEKIILCSEA